MQDPHTESKIDYHLQGKLVGHSGAVLAISVRDDGKYAASGGTDGTRVWDLKTLQSVSRIPGSPDIRGATTCVYFIKREDNVGEALVGGTQAGYLFCWQQEDVDGITCFKEVWCRQLNEPAEITGIAFDEETNRLAVCHRGGVFQLFTLNSKMGLEELLMLTIPNCTPGSIAFGEKHGNEREVLIFGVYCGLIYYFRGAHLSSAAEAWNLGCRISAVAVDNVKSILCVDDPSTGVHVYRMHGKSYELTNTFFVPVEKRPRVRQVALADSGRVIVSGSDHGAVYVRRRRNSELLAKLQVDPNEYVQTVTASDIGGVPTIFAAKSSVITGANDIFVYRQTTKSHRRFMARIGALCLSVSWYIIVFAVMAFLYETVGVRLALNFLK